MESLNFINFVNECPSPWHVVEKSKTILKNVGFEEIFEGSLWNLKRAGKYFLTRNKSTLIAFVIGGKYVCGNGFSAVAGHTDSPCLRVNITRSCLILHINLKVKPVSYKRKINYEQLGVQCYGGAIWYTWFDRDLSLAGRVIIKNKENELTQHLIDLKRPLLRIPTVAIHLHPEYNEKFVINKETHLLPITSLNNAKDSENDKIPPIMRLVSKELEITPESITDLELCLYDVQPATLFGIDNEFISASRLDNQLGSYTALMGFIDAMKSIENETNIRLLLLFDNEEVGSQSYQGADCAGITNILKRIVLNSKLIHENTSCNFEPEELFGITLTKSFLVSSDQAHAVHPNYPDKHEENHKVKLDGGFVIKHNANQRYATNANTASVIKQIAAQNNIPIQGKLNLLNGEFELFKGEFDCMEFVVRNDMGCGTTIGPILASILPMATVDIGGPQLSMHSIREMCAAVSVKQGIDLFKAFYETFPNIKRDI